MTQNMIHTHDYMISIDFGILVVLFALVCDNIFNYNISICYKHICIHIFILYIYIHRELVTTSLPRYWKDGL